MEEGCRCSSGREAHTERCQCAEGKRAANHTGDMQGYAEVHQGGKQYSAVTLHV